MEHARLRKPSVSQGKPMQWVRFMDYMRTASANLGW